eukprot:jgi/Astpho2/2032/fgenesh1_pg.00038_%23_129_t
MAVPSCGQQCDSRQGNMLRRSLNGGNVPLQFRLPKRTLVRAAATGGRRLSRRQRSDLLDNSEPSGIEDDVAYVANSASSGSRSNASSGSEDGWEQRRQARVDMSGQVSTSAASAAPGGAYRLSRHENEALRREDVPDPRDNGWESEGGVQSPWQQLGQQQGRQPAQSAPRAGSAGGVRPWWQVGRRGDQSQQQPSQPGPAAEQPLSDWGTSLRPARDDWEWAAGPEAGRGGAGPAGQGNGAQAQPESYALNEEEGDDAWGLDDMDPDITLLASQEVDGILKVAPRADQAKVFGSQGDPNKWIYQWGIALLSALVFSKLAPFAAGSATAPLWWPWLQALRRNQGIRSRYRHIGLWRTRVLEREVTQRGRPRFSTTPGAAVESAQPQLRILVGDDSGCRSEVMVPYDPLYNAIQVGEAAELILLSSSETFDHFKALKEVYLPESSLWIANYPYMDRDTFLDLSLQIERERAAEQGSPQF